MSSDRTGIVAHNSFEDARCWGELFREFNNGSLGTGIAIGDYDGDGRPDVLVANKTASVSLYRNLGEFRFEDVTEKAGLAAREGAKSSVLGWIKSAVGSETAHARAWSHGVVFADINNDGWLDISVCRFAAPNLLFINRGDGTFSEEAAARGLAVADASVVTAFCDYDRDGWLDVYVQTNLLDAGSGPDGRRDYLFRNDGAGVFVDVSANLTPRLESQGHSCIWWDYDDDGWPDLYVANDFAAPDLLYRNNRDGTFTDVAWTVLPHTPYSAMGCDTGDVDNDGLIDLFVADMPATRHEKDQRTMAVSRYLAAPPREKEPPQVSRNMLYLATGSDLVREGAFLAGVPATDWTWSPRFEDFDCDGRIDLLVTNGMNREHHNVDLIEKSSRAATLDVRIALVRDGPVLEERNFAFRNEGDLRFREVGAEWGFNELGVSFGSAVGDLDGDGDLDIVVARYNQSPAVYRNDGVSGERLVFTLRGRESNRFGIGAKVDLETSIGWQTRELWSARGYQSSSEPAVHFGLNAGSEVRQVRVRWPNGRVERWHNLSPGHAYELAEGTGERVESDTPRAAVPRFTERMPPVPLPLDTRRTEGVNALKSPRLQPRTLDDLGPSIAVADFDHDGREEVVVGGIAGGGMIWLNRDLTPTILSAPSDESPASAPLDDGPMLAFDANGDGHVDLLLSKTGESPRARPADYALRLWLGDGRGAFRAAKPGSLPETPISVGAMAAADFDRDGSLEVFVGARVAPGQYPQSTGSLLLKARDGAWVDEAPAMAPGLSSAGMVTAALCSDVDDDGWVDLIIATEWGNVRLYRNRGDGRLEESRKDDSFGDAGTGWWTALSAADFNRDGRLDYVVGNAGLNTHYRASRENPALLFQLPTGRTRPSTGLLEAYLEDGRRLPWRTRRDLGAVWPRVLRKYPNNNDYARATVEDLFGSDAISGAATWSAQELRSGVFMSAEHGRHLFLPLPRDAQIASVQGVVSGDLDGDGLADILLLHNSTDQVSGSWNGGIGQFLSGDGAGGFKAVPLLDSGFRVPGAGRALAMFDLGGTAGPGIAAARHRAMPLFYANTAELARRFLVLHLRQPGSNPRAIGSRIEIAWSDQRTSVAEVYSGGGYMTQSSSAVFLGLGGNARPERLKIRWPDGTWTAHDIASNVGELRVDRERGIASKP